MEEYDRVYYSIDLSGEINDLIQERGWDVFFEHLDIIWITSLTFFSGSRRGSFADRVVEGLNTTSGSPLEQMRANPIPGDSFEWLLKDWTQRRPSSSN